MLLSIITGTYNRLPHLKNFINSCESAMLPGIEHEYCICDGGSTDGTLEWIKRQKHLNIQLIEHGELKGAIKAFNDAAAIAKGDYLLIGNDDVVVLEDSIIRALGAILNDPTLGAACFYQDRGGKDWHVEDMEIIYDDGECYRTPYMQVGVIPKFLWDYAGGWGDFGAKTYGGDNWVSAKVYEAGYRIKAIDGARIHDSTPIDELRKINVENNKAKNDGKMFYAAFPDGIKYHESPQFPNPVYGKYKKILYAPIYEAGYPVQKEQKRGLREALQKYGLVYEVDYMNGENLAEAARVWKPDMTLTQLHSADRGMVEQIKVVRAETKQYLVNWVGDVYTEQNSTPEFIECMRYFDLHTSVNNTLAELFEKHGVNYHYWQIGYEPAGVGDEATTPNDIIFSGNIYSEKRKELVEFLIDNFHPKCNLKFLGNGYPPGWEAESTLYDFKTTGEHIRSAKIVIGDNQFGDEGFVSNRLFDSLAAGGALMLHQKVPGMKELIGFEDKKHYIEWENLDDLKENIEYYLKNDRERQLIAEAGTDFCRKSHSFHNRVHELFELLKNKPLKSYAISVHMICKNEIGTLERLIGQCRRFAEEVVVVDTGSTDGSLERLRELEDDVLKVHETEWCNDFSKARNCALEKCTKPWILWLDFDDALPERTITALQSMESWEKMLAAKGIYNPMAYKVTCVDVYNNQSILQTRLFKKIEGIKWNDPIHETVDASLGVLGIDTDAIPAVEIVHNGSLDRDKVAKKQERNIKIIKELDDSSWKFVLLAEANMALGKWAEAIICTSVIMNRFAGHKSKEISDYCNFMAGYSFTEIGLVPEAIGMFKASDFKDSYYKLSQLDKDNKIQWLMQFLDKPHPQEYSTFSAAWEPEAKAELLKWHQTCLRRLTS